MPTAPADWPMFGHDPAHTGYNPEETQLKPPLRLKWSYTTGGEVLSSPAVANGVVYVASKEGKVYALDAASAASQLLRNGGFEEGGAAPDYWQSSGGTIARVSSSNRSGAYSARLTSNSLSTKGILQIVAVTGGNPYFFYTLSGYVLKNDVEVGWARLRIAWYASTDGTGPEISSADSTETLYSDSAQFRLLTTGAATAPLAAHSARVMGMLQPLSTAEATVYFDDFSLEGKVFIPNLSTQNLSIQDNFFMPNTLITKAGTQVVWTNNGNSPHTATSDTGLWDSGTLLRGQTFSRIFDTPGAYPYNCVFHRGAGMVGTITVRYALVSALPAYQASPSFIVSWSGTPAATSYDIQHKDGAAGIWTDWITATTALSATFTGGQDGHTYYFQSRARDTAGTVESYLGGNGETSTTVDLTAPSGSILAQGWSSPYISNTVTLSVSAWDAASGVYQMQLGADGQSFGPWQTYTTTTNYLAPPGATAVYARFRDNAGNVSQAVSATINLDATPPSGTIQTQGWSSPYISNTVTLAVSASDATSGLSQMQFGPDGQSFNPWETYGTASLYLALPGATAVYGRFKDRAENVSQPVSATVNLDNIAPTGSLSINSGATYANAISATLALSATDNLSGLSSMSFSDNGGEWGEWQGYAASSSWPLASGPDGPRTAYARFRDAAQNVSPVYSDTIILDTAAPTGTVTINGGASDTNSTSVTLALSASDTLSGVAEMSFSNDGLSYSTWQDYAPLRVWNLSGGNGPKTVYVRYKDNAGNISSPATATIYLNTTQPSSGVIPLSAYQGTISFTVSWSGSALGNRLASFDIQYKDGSSGTWTDWITGTLSTSAVFTGTEGHTYYFQSRARDLAGNVEPYVGGDGHTRTTVDLTPPTGSLSINGGALDTTARTVTLGLSASDFLSGVAQASYSDDEYVWSGWESYAAARSWTVPTGEGEKAVWARFRDAAGNVSSSVSDTIRLDTSVAAAYGFSVNEGALFTSQVTVTLSLPANPNTAQTMLSNDGGFYGAAWEPYSAYRAWAVTQYGSYVIARTVYVKYKDVNGNVSATYQDDIILDLNAPSGSVSIEGAGASATTAEPMPHASAWGRNANPPDPPAGGESIPPAKAGGIERGDTTTAAAAVTLKLSASDDVSGVGGMMVSNSPAFSGVAWETFSASKAWSIVSGGKVYVTFKDNAGNASPIYATSLSGAKESLPPVVLGTVHPKTGGAVASSETGTTVSFPPGAVGAKAEVTLAPAVESSQAANTGALKGIGKFLTMTAKAGGTPVTTVSKPYTITVGYMASDIAGIDESTLGMFWWNGSSWQKELGSRVDTAARTVSAAISHLSSFAVLGESSTRRVYLPLLVREASGW